MNVSILFVYLNILVVVGQWSERGQYWWPARHGGAEEGDGMMMAMVLKLAVVMGRRVESSV